MVTVLTIKNGRYQQEIYSKSNGVNKKRIIHRQNLIDLNIQNLSLDFKYCTCTGNDIKYYGKDGNVFILKDYKKHLSQKLYHFILTNVPETVPMIYQKKLTVFSKTKLLAISLTTTTLLSLAGYMKNFKQQEVVENKAIIELDDREDSILLEGLDFEDISYVHSNVVNHVAEKVEPPDIQEEPTELTNEEMFSKQSRLETSSMLYHNELENNNVFPLATKLDEYCFKKMNKFIDSSSFDSFLKHGSNYGVDPYLLLAKAMTESSLMHNAVLPGGANFNNHAWGLMQIENVHIGEVISAYNYKTQQMDTIKITQEALKNLDTNVQIASMMFQKQLHKYHNNLYITIQSYNYGTDAMDIILNQYAKASGKSIEQILLDTENTDWMMFVEDLHANPKKYIPTWQYKTYGNAQYISKVFSYYIGQVSRNINEYGNIVDTDLVTMELVNTNLKTI